MPYTENWIHLVFSTKGRVPCLNASIRDRLFEHIRQNATKKKITLACVNGHNDHIHVLLRLRPSQSLSHVVQLIKGESSRWMNRERVLAYHFEWQSEYFAASVGKSEYNRIYNYIEKQPQHHASSSFDEEVSRFIPDRDT